MPPLCHFARLFPPGTRPKPPFNWNKQERVSHTGQHGAASHVQVMALESRLWDNSQVSVARGAESWHLLLLGPWIPG